MLRSWSNEGRTMEAANGRGWRRTAWLHAAAQAARVHPPRSRCAA